MTNVSDSDASGVTADNVVTKTPFPFWLATIELTGDSLTTADGELLNGVIILTPSEPTYIPGWSVVEGSATLTVSDGVATSTVIVCTDAVSPGFTYTITQRLEIPDATGPVPITGVTIPHTFGPAVDISALL